MFFTIIVFIVILSILVFVHELGHFVTARRAGVTVEEFGIGFPPRIIGIRKDVHGSREVIWGSKEKSDKSPTTIYSINWFPIGGFVKIKGENGDDSAIVEAGSFATKSAGVRSLILGAGVLMNVLLTIVLFVFVFSIGFSVSHSGTVPEKYITRHFVQITEVLDQSPAAHAKLQEGDIIRTVNSIEIQTIDALQTTIQSQYESPLLFVVERGDTVLDFSIVPYQLPESDRYGIGVGLFEMDTVRYPVHIATVKAIQGTAIVSIEIVKSLGNMIGDLFTSGSVQEEVAGPVGIAVMTSRFIEQGFVDVLQFAALLSINLAIINILPFPALDGGRILFIIIEKIRGRKVSAKIENIFHMTGFALLILLIIVVTVNDVSQYGDALLNAVKSGL